MPATVIWKGIEAHRSSMSVQVDDMGVATITEVYQCKDEEMANTKLSVTAADCPLGLTRPKVTGTSADRMEAGLWQVTRNFSAILDEDLIGLRKLYKCTTVANREPIQTHPRFTYFAGKLGAEVNGAVFEAGAGNFNRFKPYITSGETYTDEDGVKKIATDTIKNRKCGVTDYLMPIVRLTETKLILQEDLSAAVSRLTIIDNHVPITPIKPLYPLRTWLLSKADPTFAAHQVFKLVREWSLSGPRGWDADIYPKT